MIEVKIYVINYNSTLLITSKSRPEYNASVTNAAAHTSELELERPAPVGMVPII